MPCTTKLPQNHTMKSTSHASRKRLFIFPPHFSTWLKAEHLAHATLRRRLRLSRAAILDEARLLEHVRACIDVLVRERGEELDHRELGIDARIDRAGAGDMHAAICRSGNRRQVVAADVGIGAALDEEACSIQI